MAHSSAAAPKPQDSFAAKAPRQPLTPRPQQIEAATCLDKAIWDEEGRALFVAPVSAGKTLMLNMVACAAIERGCELVIIVSRSKHVASQSLETLRLYAPGILGGLYTGSKKQTACQILFATAPTLARHLNIVEAADLILVDEADQAYLRNETKEYSAILRAARRYAGVTGTPFILQKGRTVPIFGPGKTFDKPCGLITKNELRDLGHFHFIEPAPVTPTRRLKIDRKTKVDLSGDYDTRVQSTSDAMLSAIAADTKAAMDQLPSGQQFLFFGASTDQCDAQAVAYKSAGLTVEPYHNKLSAAEQEKAMAHFRAGELTGLCTVTKVNRGFDLPAISLVVIGFGTASRSKYEQMCGGAQRVFPGKTAAWCLDYGGHGRRFGSANWDYSEAIEFDRIEKLRIPAAELAAAIRTGRADPKCETRPDGLMDFVEGEFDLFDTIVRPSRTGASAVIRFVHGAGGLGFTIHKVWPVNGWTSTFMHCLGSPKYHPYTRYPSGSVDQLVSDIAACELPSHIILRRVHDTYNNEIKIACVGFRRGGKVWIFDDKPAVTEAWLRQRAQDRMAYCQEPAE